MPPSLTALLRRHRIAAAAAAVVVLVLAVTIVAAAASRSGVTPLTDSATCSNWTSTPVSQQFAYAQRYVDSHPAPPSASVWDAAAVRAALGSACTRAAYLGETDEVTLTAAMKHAF